MIFRAVALGCGLRDLRSGVRITDRAVRVPAAAKQRAEELHNKSLEEAACAAAYFAGRACVLDLTHQEVTDLTTAQVATRQARTEPADYCALRCLRLAQGSTGAIRVNGAVPARVGNHVRATRVVASAVALATIAVAAADAALAGDGLVIQSARNRNRRRSALTDA